MMFLAAWKANSRFRGSLSPSIDWTKPNTKSAPRPFSSTHRNRHTDTLLGFLVVVLSFLLYVILSNFYLSLNDLFKLSKMWSNQSKDSFDSLDTDYCWKKLAEGIILDFA